jgi:ribosome-associated protein
MLQVTDSIVIEEKEIQLEFMRASGPGGQKVNKVATAVQLRFDVRNSPSLSEEVRTRLIRLAGARVTEAGVLIINARRFRSQERNRQDALDRFVALVRRASKEPQQRKKSKPTLASKMRRLEMKRRLSEKKRMRRYDPRSEGDK